MEVTCRRCFDVVPPGIVDPSLGFVECPRCGTIFELTPPGAPAANREEVPMPRGVTVSRRGGGDADGPYRAAGGPGELVISLPFPRWKGVLILLVAAFLLGLAGWAAIAAAENPNLDGGGTLVAVLAVAALPIGYLGAAQAVNRRTITVSADAIDLRVGPVPWPGRSRVPARELKQLYVERQVIRTQHGTQHRYLVRMVGEHGLHDTLVVLEDARQALWLEHAIEQHLGIVDVPVVPGL